MALTVQLQKPVKMAAQIVERRAGRLRQERRVEVQSRCAAKIADGPELVVRQIARVRADGKRIGVTCDDRLFGQPDHVPEALFGHMAHVDEHPERLRPLKKVPALFRQPFVRAARRGKAVRKVPYKRDHPHTHFIRAFQQPFVLTHGLRALNGEKRGAFAALHGSFGLTCCAAERDLVRILAQLRVKIIQRTGEDLRPRQLCLDPCGAEREKLRPCAEPLRPCE